MAIVREMIAKRTKSNCSVRHCKREIVDREVFSLMIESPSNGSVFMFDLCDRCKKEWLRERTAKDDEVDDTLRKLGEFF